MTKGYAVGWLAWRDGEKTKRDARARAWQTFGIVVGGLGAMAAAVVAYLALRAGPH